MVANNRKLKSWASALEEWDDMRDWACDRVRSLYQDGMDMKQIAEIMGTKQTMPYHIHYGHRKPGKECILRLLRHALGGK